MKKVFLSLCLITSVSSSIYASYDDINAQNIFGQTPLHCASLILSHHYQQLKSNDFTHEGIAKWLFTITNFFKEMDTSKAGMSAWLIMNNGSVTIKDKNGYTPLDYAFYMKELLPTVYKVILAGKIKQDREEDFVQNSMDSHGVIDLEKAMKYRELNQDKNDAWGAAMEIILNHLPKKNEDN